MLKDDADFFLIKASHGDLIDRAGGQKRAGGLVGLSQQMMSCVRDRKHAALLSVRSKLILERDCGEPLATRVEADLLGHGLVRLAPLPIAHDSPFSAHAAVIEGVGDLCQVFSQSVADGVYSRTDAATVDARLSDLVRDIERFRRVNAAALARGAA